MMKNNQNIYSPSIDTVIARIDFEMLESMRAAIEALGVVYDRTDHNTDPGLTVGLAIIKLHQSISGDEFRKAYNV